MTSNIKTRHELFVRDLVVFLVVGFLFLLGFSQFQDQLKAFAKNFTSSQMTATFQESVTRETWPPPGIERMPTGELVGGQAEPVVPADFVSRHQPLQRRSTDPWFELQNLGLRTTHGSGRKYGLDLVLQSGISPTMKIILYYGPPGEPLRAIELDNRDVQEIRWQKPFSINLDTDELEENTRFFLVTVDSRYRRRERIDQSKSTTSSAETPFEFKISPTLFHGAEDTQAFAREWHADELRLLRSAGGEIEVHWDSSSSSSGQLVPSEWKRLPVVPSDYELNVPTTVVPVSGTDSRRVFGHDVTVNQFQGKYSPNASQDMELLVEWAAAKSPIRESDRNRLCRLQPTRILSELQLRVRPGLSEGRCHQGTDHIMWEVNAELEDGRSSINRIFVSEQGILCIQIRLKNMSRQSWPVVEMFSSLAKNE